MNQSRKVPLNYTIMPSLHIFLEFDCHIFDLQICFQIMLFPLSRVLTFVIILVFLQAYLLLNLYMRVYIYMSSQSAVPPIDTMKQCTLDVVSLLPFGAHGAEICRSRGIGHVKSWSPLGMLPLVEHNSFFLQSFSKKSTGLS